MEDVKPADGVAESQASGALNVVRVQDLPSLQGLMPFLKHNDEAFAFAMRHFRDPDTLILHFLPRSCLITTVFEHDFFGGKVAVLAWGQNPDHLNVKQCLGIAEDWALGRGCHMVVSFLDEKGPWDQIKAYTRLTGLRPFRMCFSKKLE